MLFRSLEGGKLAPVFDALLEGWKSQGYDLVPLRDIQQQLRADLLPRDEFIFGEIEGRSGTLSLQGPEFLAQAA